MKFFLKVLLFVGLLVISKFAKQDSYALEDLSIMQLIPVAAQQEDADGDEQADYPAAGRESDPSRFN